MIGREYGYEDFRKSVELVFQKKAKNVAMTCIGTDAISNKISFQELKDIIQRICSNLGSHNVKRLDRVCIVLPHSMQSVILNFALAYGGYTAVLIDASLPPEELNRLIKYSEVCAIFTSSEIYEKLDKRILKDLVNYKVSEGFGYDLFDDSSQRCTAEIQEETSSEVMAIVFSSGTTSSMKGVEITYNSIMKAFDYTSEYVFIYHKKNDTVKFLNVLPGNHIAGYSVATSCLLKGGEMGFLEEINAQNLGAAFQLYEPTVFIMIPQIYSAIKSKILNAVSNKSWVVKAYFAIAMKISHVFRRLTGRNLKFLVKPISKLALGRNMQYCGCGTSACPYDLMSFYLDLGINFVNVYGTTETGFPVATSSCYKRYSKSSAINPAKYDGVEVKIYNPDEDGIGELRVKTPLIMKGYYKEKELTKAAFDNEGFFCTGDTAFIDKDKDIHIVGRIKETIILKNGKKISPVDVDEYYSKVVPDNKIASCGILNSKGNYEEIYLFVENLYMSQNQMERVKSKILEYSSKTNTIYKLADVIFVDRIPTTSIGKIKRFELKRYMDIEKQVVSKSLGESADEIENSIFDCIREVKDSVGNVHRTSDIKKELGFDSLSLFELAMLIERRTGVNILDKMQGVETVDDLIKIVENPVIDNATIVDINNYPLTKAKKHIKFINNFAKASKILWKLKINGADNIVDEERLIICPNHESYFDAMWVTAALAETGHDVERVNCLAAKHLLDNKLMKKAFVALGGIPVDRSGNTAPAMERAMQRLNKSKCHMIIHPEGTRSRSGELGEFKQGAAKIALETQTKILPVFIEGAYEIYPPSRKLPKIFNFKRMRRYNVTVHFGQIIDPSEKSVLEITDQIKAAIVAMKEQV